MRGARVGEAMKPLGFSVHAVLSCALSTVKYRPLHF